MLLQYEPLREEQTATQSPSRSTTIRFGVFSNIAVPRIPTAVFAPTCTIAQRWVEMEFVCLGRSTACLPRRTNFAIAKRKKGKVP